jgi:hypothetical protein
MDTQRALPGSYPLFWACIVVDIALVAAAIHIVLTPGGPKGEGLVFLYYIVFPLVVCPAIWAYQAWARRWEMSRSQLALAMLPLVIALLAVLVIAVAPT